uniref:Importin N-terminal domain-containing protein n=1 Tax=Theropithecus gelada TaxID=9565 RepID=A0A8D2JU49_THEGE
FLFNVIIDAIHLGLTESAVQWTPTHKSLNFVSTLLQITMSEQLDLPVTQAGVIYLKHMITQYWPDREIALGYISPYTIPEEDRHCV